MALIPCGMTKDEYGRPVYYSIDTDDLDDAEYHYYRLAESLTHKVKQAGLVAHKILRGELTAYDIEHDAKYSWLTDDLALLVAESR